MASRNRDVFINCPFDSDYQEFFQAIVFVVTRSGFLARSALETDDSSQNRFDKICRIIEGCRYGIHDISRTELDAFSHLPRFNMPFELGVFFGAKRFGEKRRHGLKRCIILDTDSFRYQKFISDISGHDIHSHQGKLDILITKVASWLRNESRDKQVPGGALLGDEFTTFQKRLPQICAKRQLDPKELTWGDYTELVSQYVSTPL
jgi:hypothetical protein